MVTIKFTKMYKFESNDFRHRQKKMLSMLATLKATYFLSSQGQKWWGNETLEETNKRRNWDNNDYIYRGHILKGMVYSLFGIYN